MNIKLENTEYTDVIRITAREGGSGPCATFEIKDIEKWPAEYCKDILIEAKEKLEAYETKTN